MLTDEDLQTLLEHKRRHGFDAGHVRQEIEARGESFASGAIKIAIYMAQDFLRPNGTLDFWTVWDSLVDYESVFRPDDVPESFSQIFAAFDQHELATDPDTACVEDVRRALNLVLGSHEALA